MPRPPIINLEELEKLCQLQCTYAEIAAYFGITKRAVEKAAAKPEYRQAMERGRDKGLVSLRRAQFQAALGGNVTMQIWLGKNLLGQKEPTLLTENAHSIDFRDDTHRSQLESKLAGLLARRPGSDPGADRKA